MDTSPAIKLLESKLEAYRRGDWDRWVACYAENAQVFYNTASEPMSAQQAAQMHAASLVPLSAYAFDHDDDHFEARVNSEGVVEATFYGLWQATFRQTGAIVMVPTHVRYWFERDLIIGEHGFWDNTLYTEAFQHAAGTDS